MPKAQLATLVGAPPSDPDRWIYEIKFDGYRVLARCSGGQVRLYSRSGVDWTGRFPRIEADLARLGLADSILDGEVVAMDEAGRSDFQGLQSIFHGEKGKPLLYMLFDLTRHEGLDLRRVPIEERKAILRELVPAGSGSRLRYSEHFRGDPREALEQACRLSLEGIVAKRLGSGYASGRTTSWLKLICRSRQEMIVCGYTESTNPAYEFGALLLGYYEDGRLRFAGKVGTGFDRAARRELWTRMRPLVADGRPFGPLPAGYGRRVTWLRPELVAEIEFVEWTRDGRLRRPSFKGLREDKPPGAVVRERPVAPPP